MSGRQGLCGNSKSERVLCGIGCVGVAALASAALIFGLYERRRQQAETDTLVAEIATLRRHVASIVPANRTQGQLQAVTFRVPPGADLGREIEEIVLRHQWRAVNVVSCVGSLTAATLRLANATVPGDNEVVTRREKFEIVALTGTLEFCPTTSSVTRHLHLALADRKGTVWGGHMLSQTDGVEDGGEHFLPVFTTAEVCLLVQHDAVFTRQPCALSGWPELSVGPPH